MSELAMWVIYDHPSDFHTGFIARKHIASFEYTGPTDNAVTGSLEDLRNRFKSMGLVCIGRMPDDDPTITEVWL